MPAVKIDLSTPEYYINREISWIEFNRRVLEEAEDETNPLLERIKFVAIFASNLDEFFMVRVAGLKEQLDAGSVNLAQDAMTTQEQLEALRQLLLPLLQRLSNLLNNTLLPALAEKGIVIHPYSQLHSRDKGALEDYFYQTIFPLLTPLAIDSGHPFPQILNRSLNIVFIVGHEHEDTGTRAVVLQLPSVLSRFIPLKRKTGFHFVLMEEVIQAYSEALFPGLSVKESYTFRVSRDADIAIAEDDAGDLLEEMEEQVRQRRWGAAVRLEVDENMPDYLKELLTNLLDLGKQDVYSVSGAQNLTDFMFLTTLDVRALKFPAFNTRRIPRMQVENNNPAALFSTIRQQDIMIHHPFDSFSNHLGRFVMAAAEDPMVLAIKITLYRAGRNSPVVEALIKAAENGKQITAFVELKARFDEENNIIWAKELERAGVHVVYGIVGLKTHAKLMMVVRKDEDKIRTYVHLSTGNYNAATARIYTDIGYFTARENFCSDAIHLFNYLTGYSQCKSWSQFAVAPINLKETLMDLVRRETECHTSEKPGEIFLKLNALVDATMIKLLYQASQKGVRVRLLVRGICCLRPGVPGVSETIEVRSIVGRFLEHSRIFFFGNGGDEEIYASSADWMPRNLYRRVEVFFPIADAAAKNQLKQLLELYWRDNVKARKLNSDGIYTRLKPAKGEEPFIVQEYFLQELRVQEKEKKDYEPSLGNLHRANGATHLITTVLHEMHGLKLP